MGLQMKWRTICLWTSKTASAQGQITLTPFTVSSLLLYVMINTDVIASTSA